MIFPCFAKSTFFTFQAFFLKLIPIHFFTVLSKLILSNSFGPLQLKQRPVYEYELRSKKLFNAEHANVQPHSGAQANMAVFMYAVKPGDTVMGMDLSNGGHLSHGSPVNFSGLYFNIVSYGINDNGEIDYNNVREMALKHKPKLIICGASNYSKVIDFKKFKEIAKLTGGLESSVRWQYNNALKKVRNAYERRNA